MTLPLSPNIEMPILQELKAVGGKDTVRFLYERLIPYFPTLSDAEIFEIKNGTNRRWKNIVQKAGKALDDEKSLSRKRGIWSLTEKGKRAVADESSGIIDLQPKIESLTHGEIQTMLCEIGEILGYYAEREFEYYDVIWRETSQSRRISHVFEVQSKGNIDSAFAKLKRAYDAGRSKPFLILTNERDSRRAEKSLINEFSALQNSIVILSFAETRKLHENLHSLKELLPHILKI